MVHERHPLLQAGGNEAGNRKEPVNDGHAVGHPASGRRRHVVVSPAPSAVVFMMPVSFPSQWIVPSW